MHVESRDQSETISLKKRPLSLVDDILACELDVNLLSFAQMLTLAITAHVAPNRNRAVQAMPDRNTA
jgi:hypothetical protein